MYGHSERFKTLIYEGELSHIAGWVEKYPMLETGGDLFGFWTHAGNPVVQYVLGPGAKSEHNPTSFYQDKNFLIQAGDILREGHGLQHIGEWHSHHQMGLAEPSGGDAQTVVNALQKYNFPRFLLCIANLKNGQQWSQNKNSVNLGCFLFTNSIRHYQTGSWVVLPGDSPIRNALHKNSWRHKSDVLFQDVSRSDSWRGVLQETTLKKEILVTTEPIKISKGLWYATPEGKTTLKEMYDGLKRKFKNCQMFRSESEQIYFTFTDIAGNWRIELPDNFPLKSPMLQLNEKSMNPNEQWRESLNFIDWVQNQISSPSYMEGGLY